MPRVKEAAASVVINTGAQPEIKADTPPKPKIDFWEEVRPGAKQDWSRRIVYLYRTKPVTGMKVKEKYLDVFAQPFTVENVKTKYGGEEFKAILVQDGKIIATEEFSIEAPPIYDATRENPMGPNGQPAASVAGEEVTRKITDQFLEERRSENEMLTDAHKRSLDIVTDGFKQVQAQAVRTESGGDSNIINTIRVLKELGLVGQPPPNPMATMVEMMKFAKEMGFMGGGNALTGLKEQIELVKTLADAVGSGGGGGKTDIWGTLVSKAPEIIDGLGNIVGKVKDVQSEATRQLDIKARTATQIAQINAQRAAQGQPPLPAESVAPAAENVSAAPHPAGTLHTVSVDQASAAAHAPANGSAGISNDQQEQVLANFLKHRVVEMISKYQDPDGALDPAAYTAADVLTWVEDFDPRIVEFLSTLGPGGFEQFFTNDPILNAAVALPQWPKWFSEACDDLYAEAAAAQPARPQ